MNGPASTVSPTATLDDAAVRRHRAFENCGLTAQRV